MNSREKGALMRLITYIIVKIPDILKNILK